MISALYVRKDSIYKELLTDCWDIDRDARTFPGGNSIIAHPPCRSWGKFKWRSKHRSDEKELAIHAVNIVRKWGGIVEHPSGSSLWDEMKIPKDGSTDLHGGYLISIDQSWFGHRARKKTLLYIVGVTKKNLPPSPIKFDTILKTVDQMGIKEREHTPKELAIWLIKIANLANQNNILT